MTSKDRLTFVPYCEYTTGSTQRTVELNVIWLYKKCRHFLFFSPHFYCQKIWNKKYVVHQICVYAGSIQQKPQKINKFASQRGGKNGLKKQCHNQNILK
jgi:hypothetical protein